MGQLPIPKTQPTTVGLMNQWVDQALRSSIRCSFFFETSIFIGPSGFICFMLLENLSHCDDDPRCYSHMAVDQNLLIISCFGVMDENEYL